MLSALVVRKLVRESSRRPASHGRLDADLRLDSNIRSELGCFPLDEVDRRLPKILGGNMTAQLDGDG
ncbi:MAG: hypothetical protein DME00_36440 [Candidatus Rokuibacteriota bacterium]|nr:MAG: hypothetical protein DME00_36440 [Candidatus Rokubacteria bacterium]